MSVEESRYRELLGAYVLDGLRADEETELRRHLAECTTCQAEEAELRQVAGALPAEDPWDEVRLALPVDLEDRVVAAVREDRPAAVVPLAPRRQRALAWVGAVAAALVVLAGAVSILRPPPQEPVAPGTLGAEEPITFAQAPPEAEVGYATIIAHTWGTELLFSVEGAFRIDEVYTVVFEQEDGALVPAGTFIGDDIPIECELNGALLRQDAAAVTVLDPEGEPVLRSELADA